MIATNREDGGKLVRGAWIKWARTQPDPKHSWLIPWEKLSEEEKEAECQVWETIVTPYLDVIRGVREGVSNFYEAIDMLSLLEIKEDNDAKR
jgi:hypothetical protein